jgi:NAD(P)-dependent dehydrogenase (short-subunit alcohol dehydrogenase family)
MAFTTADLPDLSGTYAVVTGANSGIGLETARALALRGADVVLACRSAERGAHASAQIMRDHPFAKLQVLPLDLSSLRSVREFAARVLATRPKLDLLINNAGLMAIPRALSEDGFEMQLAVNYLGHFALTGLLLPQLLATPGARVVSVSSMISFVARMRFDDLDGAQRYRKWDAYGQSKLANLLFAFELARRADGALRSVACHPGYAATNLQLVGPRAEGSRAGAFIMQAGNALLAQSAQGGALPTLYAACSPAAGSGEFFGPAGMLWGSVRRLESSRAARDPESMRKLWEISAERTGVKFDALS